MNTNAVNTYRKKHRRCKTCVHAKQDGYCKWVCKAKNECFNGDLNETRIKGIWCEIYSPRPFKNN